MGVTGEERITYLAAEDMTSVHSEGDSSLLPIGLGIQPANRKIQKPRLQRKDRAHGDERATGESEDVLSRLGAVLERLYGARRVRSNGWIRRDQTCGVLGFNLVS